MNKKLFLICPFSQLEGFLTQKFGEAYFLTMPAAVFSEIEDDFKAAVKTFMETEGITDVYVVSDVDCPFIGSVLKKEKPFGLSCEACVKALTKQAKSPFEISRNLVRRQVAALRRADFWNREGVKMPLRLHGLVSCKKDDRVVVVD